MRCLDIPIGSYRGMHPWLASIPQMPPTCYLQKHRGQVLQNVHSTLKKAIGCRNHPAVLGQLGGMKASKHASKNYCVIFPAHVLYHYMSNTDQIVTNASFDHCISLQNINQSKNEASCNDYRRHAKFQVSKTQQPQHAKCSVYCPCLGITNLFEEPLRLSSSNRILPVLLLKFLNSRCILEVQYRNNYE